ncbi:MULTISPECIES: valine--tRNA ligase [unclassified Paracoccus (in: a-proteobacteria)]|uniref:valine--tRNA ligase n=1 Tax=unclassified Paracoccus (in: a-proteobacteria) TaxID=2688777 RepID=UPI0021E13F0E|nr:MULTISPECIES: valine--tRNA ligase [unclassified Paracoccus (in: a-proteobacteria)]UXU75607.1 valine--tRNA ligase [Paracoccus sp. SMMA_5]UXU81511.1 valine--tRNA ligase [Paracoccus sp. SMMA_5_TC]
MAMDKTFDATAAEARIAALWAAQNAFAAGANARPGAPAFSVVIPPPNVTGSLHIGHALNNTLQDILVRWHRMRGFDTLWQPGQDHAGIATQMVVERQMAERQEPGRREIGREAFLQKVWAWKQESGDTIIGQLKRLGASCDWSRNAFTMSGAPGAPAGEEGNFHDAVIKVFVDMYDKGLIYRGKRLVNWDPHFETAISDLEVENREVPGQMWHFKYPLAGGETYEYVERDADGNVTLRETRDYIAIATTRPETMLGDGAVAVHPDDARYAPIVGKLVEIPVGPREYRRLIPIITDEYPDPDFGSGAVKITGAHDFNDYAVAIRNNIPLYTLMDGKARMRADGLSYAESAEIASRAARGEDVGDVSEVNLVPEELRGLDRYQARKAVIEAITAEGLAVTYLHREIDPETGAEHLERRPLIENKPIMQPFGDRSGVVIEPMLTDQWFVDTPRIVQPAIDAVRNGQTRILPEQHRKVYFNWLENIEPWTISRQLWWGHQIPVWYGLDLRLEGQVDDDHDGALDEVEIFALLEEGLVHRDEILHCAANFTEVARRFRDSMVELPQPLEVARVIEVADRAAAIHAFSQGLAEYNLTQDPTRLVYPVWRDPDVLDTWFSSGLWPIGTLGWPDRTPELARYFPTSTLVTGFDIIFFWVARMMMMQLAVVGQVPFRDVYVHGLVRDEKGAKMSKSKGNVIDPLTLIDQYGADALRFTLTSMAAMGRDPKLGPKHVEANRNFVTKLWNASRFAEMNGVRGGGARPQPRHVVNRWIIGEVARIRIATDEALAGYRFNDAAAGLYAFVWGKVCDWYVEFSKPLFDGDYSQETRDTMGWVLDQCYTLLHPIMPFVTEELWALTGQRDRMLVHGAWPEYGEELIDAEADRQMNWVIQLIENIRSARAQIGVPAGARPDLIVTQADAAARDALAANAPLIERLARVNPPRDGAMGQGMIAVAVPGASLALPVGEMIDVAAETARLQKAVAKAEKDAAGLRGRLANPRFVEHAEAEVIDETRDKLAALDDDIARLRGALEQLAAM